MIADALILAAGRGTRLGPGNEGRPKCLARVGAKCILDWQLEALAEHNVERVVIATGFESDQIRAHLDVAGWRTRFSFEFVHNDRYDHTNVLTSWALAAPTLSRAYYYLHGDTVFESRFLHILTIGHDEVQPTLAVDCHPCAEEEMKVIARESRIVRISKELDPRSVTGEFTGVMVVPPPAHEALRSTADALLRSPDADRLFVEAALQACIDASSLAPAMVDITGTRWREVDFPEDLAAARDLLGT